MPIAIADIVESLSHRPSQHWGIGTAAQYLKEIEPCLSGGGLCPTKLFNLADAGLWKKEVDAAGSRLVYCEGDSIETKSLRDGSGITEGAILEYDAILATRQKDRDGDIVEPKGMEIDERMPLLWQHLQLSPIGKHVSIVSQDEMMVKCRFAIADTELGRDAATLIKLGALRKSHGFVPSEADPLAKYKGHDGREYVKGWHIKRCGVMEGSAVSIPANPGTGVTAIYAKEFDGICTAFGRKMLHNPLVKQWAKSIYDVRPVQVRGVETSRIVTKSGTTIDTAAGASIVIEGDRVQVSSEQAPPITKDSKGRCPKCGNTFDESHTCVGCGAARGAVKEEKQAETTATKEAEACGCKSAPSPAGPTVLDDAMLTKMYGMRDHYLEGSFEWTRDRLYDGAYKHLTAMGVDVESRYSLDIVATFATEAIVCVTDYSKSPTERKCYRLSYTTGDEGPRWSGEPQEVEIKAVVLDKAFELLNKARRDEVPAPEPSLISLVNVVAQKAVFAPEADSEEVIRTLKSAIGLIQDQRELLVLRELLGA